MQTFKVTRQPIMNPYYIAGNQVSDIVIFDQSGEIVRAGRGWFTGAYGSNNDGNSAVESIEFTRRRKFDRMRKESFFIGDILYIYSGDLPGFAETGEEVCYKGRLDIAYQRGFIWEFAPNRGKFAGVVSSRLVLIGEITRREKTKAGIMVDKGRCHPG